MSDLLNQASLVYIPSGYKEDTAYSVIPTDGSGDLTFTRASDGTRVNSSGLVENVPWNLVQYSEQFDNAYWSVFRGSITANNTISPDGTQNADKYTENSDTGQHFIRRQSLSMTSGVVYTGSIFAKAAELSTLTISSNNISLWNVSAVFNLSNGTITSGTGVIENYGNGWYRCSVSGACLSTTTLAGIEFTTSNGAGSSGSGLYIWGAQLNTGSTAKPYFPTTDRQDVPRLTYEGGCPSLLLEPQRTNLNTYSEDWSTGWGGANRSLTTNNTTSPDGTQNADKLGATGGTAYYAKSITSSTGSNAFSVFMKYGNRQTQQIYAYASGVYFAQAVFDLQNGTVSSTISGTAQIENYGNGWYRCTVIGTAGGTSVEIGIENIADGTYTYCWGAQLEAGSYATSYIPTTSAAVTRVADAVQILSMGSSVATGATSGTVFLEFEYINEISNDAFCFGQNNSFYPAGRGYIYNKTSGFADSFGGGGFTVPENQNVKIIYRLNSLSSGNIFQNGVKGATRTGTAWASIEQITIRGAFASMKVKQMAFFPTALTDAECIELTTL